MTESLQYTVSEAVKKLSAASSMMLRLSNRLEGSAFLCEEGILRDTFVNYSEYAEDVMFEVEKVKKLVDSLRFKNDEEWK